MTALDYLALAPLIAVTVTTLAVMLVIAFYRHHALVAALTGVGLLLALALLPTAMDAMPRAVTPLLYLDGRAAFFIALFLATAIVTTLISYLYLAASRDQVEEYYVLLCTATLGALVLASAQHFAALVLGLEIMAVSFYPLIAYPDRGHPPLEAGLKYLVLSGVASKMLLFGLALIYSASGSLTFATSAPATTAIVMGPRESVWLIAGQSLVMIGAAFKLSLVPFHMWTPDVYQGAPLPVTGFLATLSKASVFAVLLSFALGSHMFQSETVFATLASIAVLSMILGNLLALLQDNVKRLLAYSSVAHFGYLLIGLLVIAALPDPATAMETCLVYLAAYVAMTLTAFTALSLLRSSDGRSEPGALDDLDGLFWRRPVLAAMLTVAFLSLAGIPLTAGFIGKFYLFAAGVQGALWTLVWAMIVGSAIAVYYYLKVIFAMTKLPAPAAGSDTHGSTEAPAALGAVVTVALGICVILLGTYPTPLIEAIRGLVHAG